MDMVISADQVLAGLERRAITRGAVLVRDGQIAAVDQLEPVLAQASGNTTHLEFPEATLLPGLIDSHVHLAFDAGPDPASTVLNSTDDQLLVMMAANANRLLGTGVTTVRDLGDRGGLAMRLRDLVADGVLPGPRIVAAGTPLTVPGGHCWFLGGEAAGADRLRAIVERNAEAGADLIKVMATGGHLTPEGPAMGESQFTREELRLVVAEAARFGLPVAAHAHGTQGIADAVAAGVSTIEHCTWLGDGGFDVPGAVVDKLVAGQITVSPAISRNWRVFPQRFGTEITEQLLSRLRWYDEHEIPVIAGTDAGVPGAAFDEFVSALEVFHHVGLSNDRVLELATTAAAEALGLIETTGHLSAGTDADLLVVGGDPRTELDALRDVRLVAARGRFHVPADSGKTPARRRDGENN